MSRSVFTFGPSPGYNLARVCNSTVSRCEGTQSQSLFAPRKTYLAGLVPLRVRAAMRLLLLLLLLLRGELVLLLLLLAGDLLLTPGRIMPANPSADGVVGILRLVGECCLHYRVFLIFSTF